MEKTEEYKQCPECAEDIKVKAFICRYCGSTVKKKDKDQEGKFVNVTIKADGKMLSGEIYITKIERRVSDIMNDNRKFISLVNATEGGKLGDIKRGYIALNKSVIDWVSVSDDIS